MAQTNLAFTLGSALATGQLTDSQYVKGGYITVATKTLRNALPKAGTNTDGIIIKGSMVYVQEENKLYINVTDLIEYVTGGETDEIAVAVSAEHVATATVKKIAATKIIYKPSVGEAPEVSVAAALNDIYDQIGEGGGVAAQISAAIAGLDATVNQVGTGENGTGLTLQVIETDGTLTAVAGSINTITGEDINKLFETTTV